MRKYIVKRLLWSILILFFVSFLIYLLMRSLPSSYVETVARERAAANPQVSYKQWLERLNELYGLNVNPLQGFFIWLSQALRGHFGDSWYYGVPVTQKFGSVIWYSFALGAAALIFQVALAIPLGIQSARKQYSTLDYATTVFALIGISLPGFFFITILKMVFAVNLGWFDLNGIVGRMHDTYSPFRQFLDICQHMVLPTLNLVIIGTGSLLRYTRTNMLEVLNSDYIRTARAEGLSERRVINHHAFRNTLIPLVTIIGGTLPGLFSGALITETLFKIPGIGYTSYEAMLAGDIPFTMFYLTFMAILTLLGTLISDVLYAVVDPRVRVS
ncbi:MAG: ABC transporter permease [Oscillospiraceae bacterium]|nr:ABC transporter permease [Oscillospiraceae bacterium]MDD4368041.1 ABC transporter permease [Oscillospiraceae bacterium]